MDESPSEKGRGHGKGLESLRGCRKISQSLTAGGLVSAGFFRVRHCGPLFPASLNRPGRAQYVYSWGGNNYQHLGLIVNIPCIAVVSDTSNIHRNDVGEN